MQDVQVKVYTEQVYASHTDTNEQTYKGKIAQKKDHRYIIYIEEDKENGIKITNQIKIGDDQTVTVRRMGIAQSILYFERNKPHTTFYNTLQGSLEVTLLPTIVDYTEGKAKDIVRLEYELYMGDNKTSDNVYLIEVMKGDTNENS